VYYTSQAFQGAEAKYARIEKDDLLINCGFKEACLYFQAHTIMVMTDQPI